MRVVMDDLRELNGGLSEDSLVLSSSPSSSSLGQDLFSIGSEPWVLAERATEEIICQIQPTIASEQRRKKVVEYVQMLLKSCIACEVFPFGSVPLKTYLPDGDIDLTAFGGPGSDEPLANKIFSILEREDQNPSAECTVKDVQCIRAEVKLVKCLVEDIVVDISFNQLGGLCTLCFLEQVDRLIGKNHLFKRSIILIKAWCYYESRILGAHHGLISTYGLETLVLYIFHLFHSSLNGPLAVLYKFLDYFSKFDWENYCVSLNGPVPISSLPEIVAEKPENNGCELLLSEDIIKELVEKFSVPTRGTDASSRVFIQKHLNIVDPLKESNNLGRSVSKGNFFRIRSAFSYGARKLGQILLKSNGDISGEVCKFFTNTLDRHGKGIRPDVQGPHQIPLSDFTSDLSYLAAELAQEDSSSHEAGYLNLNGRCDEGNIGSQGGPSLFDKLVGTRVDLDQSKASEMQRGGVQKLAPTEALKAKRENENKSTLSCINESKSPVVNVPYAPHLYFSRSLPNGKVESGHEDDEHLIPSKQIGGEVSQEQEFAHSQSNHKHLEEQNLKNSLAQTPESFLLEDSQCSSSSSDRPSAEAVGYHETSKSLPDLTGDFETHLENLHKARMWCDHPLGTPYPALHPQMHWGPGQGPWDAIQFPLHMRPNMFAQVNANGAIPRPPFLPMTPMVPGTAFGIEELPRTRGTGTYFPNTNYHSYRDRPSPGKGRIQAPLKSPRGNGQVATFPSEKTAHVKNINRDQLLQPTALSPVPSPRGRSRKGANGFIEPSERGEEYSSAGRLPSDVTSLDRSGQVNSSTAPATEGSQVINENGLAAKSYHLKDEEDFPPLSV